MALAETLKRHHLGSASLPSSPVAGRSVLDMHRFLAHDIATSTSEEESRSWRHEEEEEEDEDERAEGEGRGRPIRQLSSASAVQEPCSVFFPGSTRPLSTGGSLPATTPWRAHSLGLQSSLPRRASSTGLLGLNALGMEYFQNASDVWGSDAWADAALKAAAARRAPSLGLSAEDDGDVMMLPVDLSAFDPAGSLL